MSYEKLSKTKFFENYQKALKKELSLEIVETVNTNENVLKQEKIYSCTQCNKILIERKYGKYIFSEKLNASFLKEIRIKCPCGKVNIFKGDAK
ncbi:hypothetical protein [Cetobacterium sp.]|uniref:hypothetical protein n=1 Tax=Cetobacterium sp. TaxID=2071632 RepID=UPI003EE7A9AB